MTTEPNPQTRDELKAILDQVLRLRPPTRATVSHNTATRKWSVKIEELRYVTRGASYIPAEVDRFVWKQAMRPLPCECGDVCYGYRYHQESIEETFATMAKARAFAVEHVGQHAANLAFSAVENKSWIKGEN